MRYIKIDLKTKNSSALPPFIGSMLRGAFGVSLKRVVCINPSYNCEGCFAKDSCLYYEFYEEKNRFHHYRFDFELEPKKLEFSLYLFNEATQKYPYVLSAIYRMLTEEGLGVKREKFEIDQIDINKKTIYNGKFLEADVEPIDFFNKEFAPLVKVILKTPLRLKKDGRFVKAQNLDIKDILISIYKKRAFFDKESQPIEQFPTVVMKNLEFKDFTRYSNRQKRKMRIGGIIGEMIIKDLTPQTYELLQYGQRSGVGKLNTFGLGKIEVEPLV